MTRKNEQHEYVVTFTVKIEDQISLPAGSEEEAIKEAKKEIAELYPDATCEVTSTDKGELVMWEED